jgi:tetratricopeptide (TPR) repeat protein
MRNILIILWLLVPVAVAAYHFGPGQEKVTLDEAGLAMKGATQAVEESNYLEAIERFDEAIEKLPDGERDAIRRLTLEKAKVQMKAKQLPQANEVLKTMVDELATEKGADPQLLADAREAYANSQYYMTWLMRLEGLPRDVWEPEIEVSRQNYRLLAENAVAKGQPEIAKNYEESLEASIRLARLDLTELQGLPLPSQ